MIARDNYRTSVETALRRAPICFLAGPRQVGKTTLAQTFLSRDEPKYFDLEDPVAVRRFENPLQTLTEPRPLVVIDEVQRMPELFPLLRVLVDRYPQRRFLLLGSASPAIMKEVTESLAGRVERVILGGFGLSELGTSSLSTLWLRGGFPRSFLSESDADSFVWREQFMAAIAERDMPSLGIAAPAKTLLRFWSMIAHSHAAVWNGADPARSLGLSESTIRKYLDVCAGLHLVRLLQPWYENLSKRQVKSPKVIIEDSGLLNALLGLRTYDQLLGHPKCGSSWEGFVIREIELAIKPDESHFWATHAGAELDLLVSKNGRRYGFEIKRSDAPSLTASMRVAMEDLRLDALWAIYPGSLPYRLSAKAWAWPVESLGELALAIESGSLPS